MRYYKRVIVFSVVIIFIVSSCDSFNNKTKNTTSASENIHAPISTGKAELKVGGLYLLQNADSTYYVSKILALDNFALHSRTYSNKFTNRPREINSAMLDILIGHAPLDKHGFLLNNPELLKVEEVKDFELEGYKMYLEAMKQ